MKKRMFYALIGLFMIPVSGCQTAREPLSSDTILRSTLSGAEIDRYMDYTDEFHAQLALEYNQDKLPRHWENPVSHAIFTIIPSSSYQNASDQRCREFKADIFAGGNREVGSAIACRQPNGVWRIRH